MFSRGGGSVFFFLLKRRFYIDEAGLSTAKPWLSKINTVGINEVCVFNHVSIYLGHGIFAGQHFFCASRT